MIMTHSDDKGLVLPPRLASTHVVIVPILSNSAAKAQVLEAAHQLALAIREEGARAHLPYSVGVTVDQDETKQPGWKFHEYELLGTPVRIEVGPRDLEKGQVVVTRRDEGKKQFIPLSDSPGLVISTLVSMQKELLEKARAFRDANTFRVETYSEFKIKMNEPGGFLIAPWCQSKECETRVKEETKATIRCLPLDSEFRTIHESKNCMVCEKAGGSVRAIFAKNY
jgi:prolyl-tRNA synthetase